MEVHPYNDKSPNTRSNLISNAATSRQIPMRVSQQVLSGISVYQNSNFKNLNINRDEHT